MWKIFRYLIIFTKVQKQARYYRNIRIIFFVNDQSYEFCHAQSNGNFM